MCHSSSADRSAGSSCSSFCASVVFPEQGSPTIKWRVATLLTPKGHLEAAERLRAERRHRAAAYMKSRRGGVRSSEGDRKSTRLNSSHQLISYAVFCLK